MSVDDGTGTPPPLNPRHQAPEPPWPDPPLIPAPPDADLFIGSTDPTGLRPDRIDLQRWNLALGDRIDTTQRALTGLASVLLVLVLVFGFLLYRESHRISDLDTARVADTTQQLTVNAQLRAALCATDTALINGYNVTSRRLWPAGPDNYDQTTQTLRQASERLRCAD